MSVLFVCEGNKMRSQMAAAFYNQLTDSHDALSAGAIAGDDTPISDRCLTVMREVGLDLAHARSRRITQQMAEASDTIIMFPTEYMPDYVARSSKTELWDVADPHYHKDQGMDFVRQVRDEIYNRVVRLAEAAK